jgi:hypothetical protein
MMINNNYNKQINLKEREKEHEYQVVNFITGICPYF